ncbi:cytochrome P450 [Suillus plorans]|uniref:Cytochrome P450 n=1 Tax=Suillus plorans TaxID=116603 RepID=A0A9P7DB87_9AGAM|nr:cytochrome P450 [Suillus plorans]KAG1785838.1 cytochrome P450 [Suillus plorans]
MALAVDRHLAILAGISLSFVAVKALRRFIKKRQNNAPLPPGPVPLPLLGSVLSINAYEPWPTYTEWSAVYGDLLFVRSLDEEITSQKPYWTSVLVLTISSNTRAVAKFRPMQIKCAREIIVNLVDDPQNYHDHFATFSLSVVMSTVYDYDIGALDDPMVQTVIKALVPGLTVLTPERALLLKTFPFLLKVPDWCWGSSIKRSARGSRERLNAMADIPFRYVQQHMADSSLVAQSSMVAENLRRMERQEEAFKPIFENALNKAGTTAIIASYETTAATLMVFFLAMVLYPEVQKRAQAEIDSVVGKERLRTEHRYPTSMQSCERLGDGSLSCLLAYHMPLRVMMYTMGISFQKRYPDASNFIPERFIDSDGALTSDDPAQYIFGLGRRICPGRYNADSSAWAAIAIMLATLDISSAKDSQGKAINFTPKFIPGVVR